MLFYLDNRYFEQMQHDAGRLSMREGVNYAMYYDTTQPEASEIVLLPSVVAIASIEGDEPSYLFGYDALAFEQAMYAGESF